MTLRQLMFEFSLDTHCVDGPLGKLPVTNSNEFGKEELKNFLSSEKFKEDLVWMRDSFKAFPICDKKVFFTRDENLDISVSISLHYPGV